MYCLTDREAFAAFLAAGARIQRLNEALMKRRSARGEGECWDKQGSMAAEKDAVDKIL